MAPRSIDTTIRSVKTNPSSVFNIIETTAGFYYTLKDNSTAPQPTSLKDSCRVYISNGENNEYWAYNQLLCRETLILCKAHREIYKFEEPTLGFTFIDKICINFHVLDNRWVIVIILNKADNTVICRTHDILKKKSSQTTLLADIHFPIIPSGYFFTLIYNFIHTYTIGNQIIIFTPIQIAKLGVQPDDGTQAIRLDFKLEPTTIFDQVMDKLIKGEWHSSDLSIQLSIQRSTSDETTTPNLFVYWNHNYRNSEYHCLTETRIFLGIVNIETLETNTYYSYSDPKQKPITPQFPGVYEYLAPDIIIHRPDVLHCREQYLTLLVPSDNITANIQQIRINIHWFEPRKEQRKYYLVNMADDGRFFTLIYKKSQDNTWTIYQVDRQSRQIIHMVIAKPKIQDIHIEITKTHSIRVYNFNLNQDTIRKFCPSTANMVSVLTNIPETIARIVSQFAKQKIISY